jgi:phospholipid-binding lipoprotein MlaA
VFLQGLQLVDLRTQLFIVDAMREGAADDYALVRDSWLQRRNYQIHGDDALEGDDSLPEYLRDEANPTVPIDAMPIPDGR